MHLLKFEAAEVRMFEIDGALWWVASDVAMVLGYREADRMTRWLKDDEKGTRLTRTLSGDQNLTIISESGLYQAIFRSRREEAEAFRRWVTTQVLPSIRIHGQYPPPPVEPLALPTKPKEVPATQTGRLIEQIDTVMAATGRSLPVMLKAMSIPKGQWTLLEQGLLNIENLLHKKNRWLVAMSLGLDVGYVIYGQSLVPHSARSASSQMLIG